MMDPVAMQLSGLFVVCFKNRLHLAGRPQMGVHGLVLLDGKQVFHDTKVRKLFVTQSRETSARPRRPQRACHRRTRPNQPSSCAASTAPI